ncbi:MAG: hypothetical protein C5B59_17335 [Bacteroidetes bacterium]|nr:MAG: hypothetical protein C5B59_17335 [Bacteroidota bacterium]
MAANPAPVEQEQPPAGFSAQKTAPAAEQEQPPSGFTAQAQQTKPDVSGIPNVYAPYEKGIEEPPIPGLEQMPRTLGEGAKSNLPEIPWGAIHQLGWHPETAPMFDSMYGKNASAPFIQRLQGSEANPGPGFGEDFTTGLAGGAKSAFVVGGAIGGGMIGAGGGPAALATIPAGTAVGAMAGANAYDAIANLVHAWRGDKDTNGNPIVLRESTVDMLRTGLSALGGTAGTAMTLPFKTEAAQLMGKVVTGAAGSSIGTFTGDQAAAVAKTWGLLPASERTPTMLQSLQDSARDGLLNLAWGTAMAGAPIAAKTAVGKIFGLYSPEARTLYDASQKLGIPISLSNLSTNKVAAAFQRIANIFPLLAHPLDHLLAEQKQAITQFTDNMFARQMVNGKWVGLGKPPVEADLSWASMDAAKSAYTTVDSFWRGKYNELLATAATKGSFIPTARLQVLGNNLLDQLKSREFVPETPEGEEPGQPTPIGPNIGFSQKELQLATDLSKLPDKISLSQMDGILQRAETLYQQGGVQGRKVEGLEDLASEAHMALRASKLGKQFNAIDTGWNNALQPFKTAVGKEFNKADKNAFIASLSSIPGSTPEAELGKMIYSMSSPDQVAAISKIVGPDLMRKAASSVMEQAVIDGRSEPPNWQFTKFFNPVKIFDQEKFARALGLDNPNSDRWQAVKMALSGTGINPDDLQKFVNVMKLVNKNQISRTSTMIARTMTLGGTGMAFKYFFPLMEAEVHGNSLPSMAASLIGIASAYKGVQMVGSAQYLNTVMRATNFSLGELPRRMAYLRLFQLSMPFLGSSNEDTAQKVQAVTDKAQGLYQSIAP